jgi:acylphosphatase
MYALVEGRVQGVGFRYSAVREAQRLSVNGWVRNLDSGDVEVWAEGEIGALEAFRGWLEKGPPGAFVTDVRVSPREAAGYGSFDVEF